MRKTSPLDGLRAVTSRQTVRGIGLVLAAVWACAVNATAQPDDEIENGRRIYQSGILPTGAPLKGTRLGAEVSGSSGACITCHNRSGMGSVEGDLQVSPITGNYLFDTDEMAVATMDRRSGKAFNQKHDPYTEASLAMAIRAGVNNRGQSMSPAMPRYILDDQQMKALTAYLRQLSSNWSPGVTADTIRFATVITPDVDPVRRRALITTLRSAFAQKNGATLPGRRYMGSPAEMVLRTGRKWELDIWELQGPPESWLKQLETNYNSKPIFALVSGTSNSSWKPVEEFCEREKVPCWFPSIDMVSTRGFYSLYFSRGVALEADVLSRYLRDGRETHKVVQLFREEYAGRGAAKALTNALLGSEITVENRVVSGPAREGLAHALAGIDEKDAVMLWLRPDDLKELKDIVPPHSWALFFSAGLAGNDGAFIPATWKQQARLVYPYELPEKRGVNLTVFRAWMKQRRLTLEDERLQAEAYFAVDFLSDTVSEMLGNLYRDYLVERAEEMIVRREGGKAEGEARQFSVLGSNQSALQMQREGTSIYPRLSLGPGQRFASKGGYVVRFEGERLVADSKWIVP